MMMMMMWGVCEVKDVFGDFDGMFVLVLMLM